MSGGVFRGPDSAPDLRRCDPVPAQGRRFPGYAALRHAPCGAVPAPKTDPQPVDHAPRGCRGRCADRQIGGRPAANFPLP